MARYTGPKSRIARKFGEAIFGADKVLAKRNYPPGQHGNTRRRKTSEYGVMLAEKQKAKYTYGVLEKQFRNMFEKAASQNGITGELLLQAVICLKKQQVRMVLLVNFCYRHLNVVLIMLCSVWVSPQLVLQLVSW